MGQWGGTKGWRGFSWCYTCEYLLFWSPSYSEVCQKNLRWALGSRQEGPRIAQKDPHNHWPLLRRAFGTGQEVVCPHWPLPSRIFDAIPSYVSVSFVCFYVSHPPLDYSRASTLSIPISLLCVRGSSGAVEGHLTTLIWMLLMNSRKIWRRNSMFREG